MSPEHATHNFPNPGYSMTGYEDSHASESQVPASEVAMQHFRQFARERPEVVALWCFGIGFVLGWKLKIW